MSLKNWFVFIGTLVAIMFLCSVVDTLVVGVFALIIRIFNEAESVVVFKWGVTFLMIIEFLIFTPYIYKTTKEMKE